MGLNKFLKEQKHRKTLANKFVGLVEELKILENKVRLSKFLRLKESSMGDLLINMIEQVEEMVNSMGMQPEEAAQQVASEYGQDPAIILQYYNEMVMDESKKRHSAGHSGQSRKDNAHMPPPTRDLEDSPKQKKRRRRKDGKNICAEQD